jgi:carbon monoxide dehydrogenase subunit G
MAFTVPFSLDLQADFAAPAARVFSLLADVPASAAHFPQVERLQPLGDSTYRWQLQKLGGGRVSLQTVYAARYRADRKALQVQWQPVAGIGNARIGGSWTLQAQGRRTRARLQLQGEIDVALPGLMKPVVVPVVLRENERLVQQYLHNLAAHFAAGT